ncbi:myb-like protein X [Vespula squamosa]|uniref:Myb-like protein X n=1 Tax=Vespula squamosa TaxID=30214 RepID=A0ABD2BVS5_VESSQ
MAVTTNFNKTNMALFYKGLSERGHRILFSKDPNVDSVSYRMNRRRSRQEEKIKINLNADSVLAYRTNNNLDSTCLKNNSAKVIEEEEEVDEEEEGEEEEEEEVKDEGKDYEATLVYDTIDDLFYLDNDYSQIYLIHIKTRLISGRS